MLLISDPWSPETKGVETSGFGRYIVVAPGVCGGRPTFKYTRIDVRHALSLLATGRTVDQVAHAYAIPAEAVQEALELAARVFDRHGGALAKGHHRPG
jgi:uncharacterized protein (DUF433 family)